MQLNHRVWFYRWNNICSGNIAKQKEDPDHGPYYEIHLKTIGEYRTGGTTMCFSTECFKTKEECIADHNRRVEETVAQYKNDMSDVDALIQFCLNHPICCGDDCEWEARRAVMERATELGFHISE